MASLPATSVILTAATTSAMDFSSLPGMPMLPLDDDPPGFDYEAFLQAADAEYLAEVSSASTSHNGTVHADTTPATAGGVGGSPSPAAHFLLAAGMQPPQHDQHRHQVSLSPSNSATATSSGGAQGQAVGHLKPRHERRGHTKSRRGCFNCKRRRIKCQETRPACGHCVKTGLKCEYPTLPSPGNQPQTQPIFSLQDMRFLQHFLVQCYPHYPVGAERIWLHEIPCLSERYEYLMHGILGFAASDLMQHDSSPALLSAAMEHRVKAIRAIKKTLADVSLRSETDTYEAGNAMMATCFMLMFQSVFLGDGMAEYMTFIRGIVVVAKQMYGKGAKLIFGDFMGNRQNEVLAPYMEKLPLIRKTWTDSAFAAVQSLGPLCRHPVELAYHDMLTDMCRQLYVSSFGAYQALSKHYGWWMMLPQEEFAHLIDPSNQVCLLLGAHWIAIKQIMAIITETERAASTKNPDSDGGHGIEMGIIRWLKYLNGMVDLDHMPYNQWPLWVEAQLESDRSYFGKTF